jgi:thioesterase domain-containing protein
VTALRVLRTGDATPIAMIHPVTGEASCYDAVAAELADHTVYAFEAPGLHGGEQPASIADIARDYLAELPPGPVLLFGWSTGGIIAYEMAQHRTVAGLALLEVRAPVDAMVDAVPGTDLTELKTILPLLARFARLIEQAPRFTRDAVAAMSAAERIAAVAEEALRTGFWRTGGDPQRMIATFQTLGRLGMSYRPAPYARRLTLFEVTESLPEHPRPPTLGWEPHAADRESISVGGNVFSCLHPSRCAALGRTLLDWARYHRA